MMSAGILAVSPMSSAFDVKAWQSIRSDVHDMQFPENAYSDVSSRPNVGISFSGGGDRAFTASIGYLAGIHELGGIDSAKYMVGVSGGSWATVVYSYYQDDSVDDMTMLGPVVRPADISRDDLQYMEEGCVRAYPSTSYKWLSGYSFEDNLDGIQTIYLDPSGLNRGKPFSYDDATVADIVSRNPSFSASDFYTMRGKDSNIPGIDDRPFPIVATTMIGPHDMLPATPDNREYTILEFTPLSVGVAFTDDITYKMKRDSSDKRTLTIGGLIEPFAFGGDHSPSTGLDSNVEQGRLIVPDSDGMVCDLALAVGSSSYAMGCSYAASSLSSLQNNVGQRNYFSPSHPTPSSEFDVMSLADGAGVQNTNVISLLQRNVQKMVLFVSTSTPMYMSDDWNPATDRLSVDYVDFTIPALFGHIASDVSTIGEDSFDLVGSTVFAYDEWVPLAKEMQRVQALGKGIVVTARHTTVANAKYGIEAGRKVDVVWVYLGRSSVWESQLSDEMKDMVIPESDPSNLASLRKRGPFDKFPHYTTTIASINKERANLLADYCGWLMIEHRQELKTVLSSVKSAQDESSSSKKEFYQTTLGIAVLISGALVVAGLATAVLFVKIQGWGEKTSIDEKVVGAQEMTATNNPVLCENA